MIAIPVSSNEGDKPSHQVMKQREVHISNFAIFCMM